MKTQPQYSRLEFHTLSIGYNIYAATIPLPNLFVLNKEIKITNKIDFVISRRD